MKVKVKNMPVWYNGKRHEKDSVLEVKKEVFDENLFESLEKAKAEKTEEEVPEVTKED